jgi:hypothetical protein
MGVCGNLGFYWVKNWKKSNYFPWKMLFQGKIEPFFIRETS